MKVIEILKLGQNIANALQEKCVKLSDFDYINLYDEYLGMMKEGLKKCYIVAFLADKYRISERKVYYIIKKFSEDCKIGAV